jgi:hypothetical protein
MGIQQSGMMKSFLTLLVPTTYLATDASPQHVTKLLICPLGAGSRARVVLGCYPSFLCSCIKLLTEFSKDPSMCAWRPHRKRSGCSKATKGD